MEAIKQEISQLLETSELVPNAGQQESFLDSFDNSQQEILIEELSTASLILGRAATQSLNITNNQVGVG